MHLLHHLFEIKAFRRPNAIKLRRKERRLQRAVETEFEKQKNHILKELKKILLKKARTSPAVLIKYREHFRKSDESTADNIFDGMEDLNNALEGEIIDQSGETITFGAKYRIEKMKLAKYGISFDLNHPLAIKYLQETRPLILSSLPETTKRLIKPILVNAISTGASYNETAKLIAENYALSTERATMIAVNEIGSAYEVGNMCPMWDINQIEGFESIKHWQTVNDDRVTEECMANQEEGWLNVEEPFASGDLTAPRVSNPKCRCTVLYEVKTVKD